MDESIGMEGRLSGNMAKLYATWKRYFAKSVWRNEHLCFPLFVQVLGIWLGHKGVRLQYHGRHNYPRIHIFIIQQSGSGKGEAMKAAHELLQSLGIEGHYLSKTSDPGLVGTIKEGKEGKPDKKYGLFYYAKYLYWDEGSMLLKSSPHSEDLQDNIQMATDDQGSIEKALANGYIKYTTSTAICAGSYLESHINAAILGRGFFQRMLVIYHIIPKQETIDFNLQKAALISATLEEKEAEMHEFANELNSIGFEGLRKVGESYVVDYDKQASEKFSLKLGAIAKDAFDLYRENDGRTQIMSTYLTRSNQALMVAGILAAINGKQVIGDEELDIGLELWFSHLNSANNILLNHNKLLPANQREEYWQAVYMFLLAAGKPIAKTKLGDALWQSGKLKMGITNIRKLVDEFIAEGKLVVSDGKENNLKLVSLPQWGGAGA